MNTTAAPPDTATLRVAAHFSSPIWEPKRRVQLVIVKTNGRVTQRRETHQALAERLAAHIDTITTMGAPYRERVIARVALEHVLSDADTGSSLAAWPEPRALVDIVLAKAYDAASISTQWPDL